MVNMKLRKESKYQEEFRSYIRWYLGSFTDARQHHLIRQVRSLVSGEIRKGD